MRPIPTRELGGELHLGLRQVEVAHESQEQAFQDGVGHTEAPVEAGAEHPCTVAAATRDPGKHPPQTLKGHESPREGNVDGRIDLPPRNDSPEIDQRASRLGYGDTVADGHILSEQVRGAMHHHAGSPLSLAPGHGHFDHVSGDIEVPQRGRRAVRRDRVIAKAHTRGEHLLLPRPGTSRGPKHLWLRHVEPSRIDADPQHLAREVQLSGLRHRREPMLGSLDTGERCIGVHAAQHGRTV